MEQQRKNYWWVFHGINHMRFVYSNVWYYKFKLFFKIQILFTIHKKFITQKKNQYQNMLNH